MDIQLKIFGTEELFNLFKELTVENQQAVIRGGFRKSGNIILREAKSNFRAGTKIRNKDGVEKAFRMQDITDAKGQDIEGVQIGNASFIARFLEGGTKDRKTKGRRKLSRGFRKGEGVGKGGSHSTGKIMALHFLEKATESKGDEAVKALYENIRASYDMIIRKYSK